MRVTSGSPTAAVPSRSWYPKRWKLLALPMLAFIALPILAIVMRAFGTSLTANLMSPVARQAIAVSLQTTLISTVIIVFFGTPLSLYLALVKTRTSRIIDTLVDMPTVLPPAVAGVAMLVIFGRRGLIGGILYDLGIQIAFTQAAVIMAQVFIAAPFFIKSAALGFASVETESQQAAALDGATGWHIFRYIFVPLSWPSLVSGILLSWARALGEFGATIIFAGNFPGRTQTMPLAIYIGFEIDLQIALSLSVILVGFSFLILFVVKLVLQREEL